MIRTEKKDHFKTSQWKKQNSFVSMQGHKEGANLNLFAISETEKIF